MLIFEFIEPTYASNQLQCYLRSSRILNGDSLMSHATLLSIDALASLGLRLSILKCVRTISSVGGLMHWMYRLPKARSWAGNLLLA